MPYRELLAALPLTAGADPAGVDRLAAAAHTRRLARGQILFVEGEPADHLYVVAAGRIRVLVTSPGGDVLVLAVLEVGDSLGDLSILDGGPRSAGAEALDRVELVAVPAAALTAFFLAEPAAVLAVARDLAATVRRLTGSTADLVFLDLPRRVAKFLLDSASGPGALVDLQMSQTELAARLGGTRQSVNRALGALHRRGWIDPRPDGTIHLTDRDALHRYADS